MKGRRDEGRKRERVEGAWEWRIEGEKGEKEHEGGKGERELRVMGVEMEAGNRRKSMREERKREETE